MLVHEQVGEQRWDLHSHRPNPVATILKLTIKIRR